MPIREGSGRDPEELAEVHEDNEETALIPKSLLMGKEVEPGDQVVLDVVHVYEDEVAVCYPKEKEKEPMEQAQDELDDMAEGDEDEDMGGY